MKLKPATLLPLALLVGGASSPMLFAQEETKPATTVDEKKADAAPKADKAEKVEKIQVTGSRIKRIDVEGASPVNIIDRQSIDNSGVTTVRELLSNFSSTTSAFDGGGSSVAGGVSSISLKGLGEGRTLVLLDGVRMPKHPEIEGFDLNSLPLAAIERVEVLNQSAAAIYGSDAIGGVINIITRKNFEGAQIEVQASHPIHEGGGSGGVNGVIGINSGKLTSTLVLSVYKEDILYTKDRDFSRTRASSYGFPGMYSGLTDVGGEETYETWNVPGCPNHTSATEPNASCAFNYNDFNTLTPSIKRASGLYNFSYNMDSFDITGKLIATRQESASQLRPENNAGQAYNIDQGVIDAMDQDRFDSLFPGFGGVKPTADGVDLDLRLSDFGNSVTTKNADMYGATLGVNGSTESGWDWKMGVNASISKTKSVSNNKLRSSVFADIITSGEYIPWDPNRDLPGIKAKLITDSTYTEQTTANGFEASATSQLGNLPGGAIGVAFAAGIQGETYKVEFDEESSTLDALINVAGAGGDGKRSVAYFAAETSLPIAKSFELDAAARYDNYSDFGSAISPQLSFLASPLSSVKLRGSVGTAFKAPSLDQMHGAVGVSFNSVVDYPYCAENSISDEDCESDPYTTAASVKNLRRGNDDLTPEKSFVYGFGFVVQPLDALSVSADYWKISSKDLISRRDLQDLVDEGSELVKRGEDGLITEIDYPLQNLSKIIRSGIDASLNYALNAGSTAIQLKSLGTWYLEDKIEPKGEPMENYLGKAGSYKWKLTNEIDASFTRSLGMSLSSNTIGTHMKSTNKGERLPQYTRYDVQGRVSPTEKTQLALGCINLLDKQGGVDDSSFGDVDSSIYNIRGREYYLRLTVNM